MNELEVSRKLAAWAREELGLHSVPSSDELISLCKGTSTEILYFLTQRVRSREHTQHIRDNLRVQGKTSHHALEKIATEERTRALKLKLSKLQAQFEQRSFDVEELRRELYAEECTRSRFQRRRDESMQREALEVAQGVRISFVTAKLCDAQHKLESKRSERPSANDVQSTDGRISEGTLREEIPQVTAVAKQQLSACQPFTELLTAGRFQPLPTFRSKLVADLREHHVQIFLTAQLHRTRRRAIEQRIATMVATTGPKSALDALLQGEQAAHSAAREALAEMQKETSRLQLLTRERQWDFSAVVRKQEEYELLNATASCLQASIQSNLDTIEQSVSRLVAIVEERLPELRSDLQQRFSDYAQVARGEIDAVRAVDVHGSKRISVGNKRLLQERLFLFGKDRPGEGDEGDENVQTGLPALLFQAKSADQILSTVLETYLRHENAKLARKGLEQSTALVRSLLDPEGSHHRSEQLLRRVQQVRTDLISSLEPTFQESTHLVTASIPRLQEDASRALKEWWEQPVRQAAPWKRIAGTSLQERELEEKRRRFQAQTQTLRP